MGVLSVEKRLIDAAETGGITMQARYCELVVQGQYDPSDPTPTTPSDFPESVVLNAGVPVLTIPYSEPCQKIGSRARIAWDGSMEARWTIHDAITLLKRAELVEVVVFHPTAQPEVHGQPPSADLALYLTRHNIKVNVKSHVTSGDIGNALLTATAGAAADLIVMGCYGHSRFREVLLGGVTRTILDSMTVPVLMSH